MAKGTRVRDQDKFVLRLPNGMRDRIKSKADRAGLSMNEAIVWCLEQYFPAAKTIDEKIDELVEMVAILKGDNSYDGVDRLVGEIHDAIVDVAEKKVETPENFRKAVTDRFDRWQEEEQERLRDRRENPFDDSHYSDPTYQEGEVEVEGHDLREQLLKDLRKD
jgi:Arc-like DNA binding domain